MAKKKPEIKDNGLNIYSVTYQSGDEISCKFVQADHFVVEDGLAFFYGARGDDYSTPELLAVMREWNEIAKQDKSIFNEKIMSKLQKAIEEYKADEKSDDLGKMD